VLVTMKWSIGYSHKELERYENVQIYKISHLTPVG
ncbi:uncharacterized protein METZ01_LOCUS501123, partial [marine metagenome]